MSLARRVALMFVALLAFNAMVASFNFLVNPYGAWRVRLISDIYRNVHQERVETPYMIRTAAPSTLLLGSSRMLDGIPIEQGCRDGIENAGLSGATLEEIGKLAAIGLRNPRLRRIVWSLDFFAFAEDFSHCDPATCARLEGDFWALVSDTLLSAETFDRSRRVLGRAIAGRSRLLPEQIASVPWPPETVKLGFEKRAERGLASASSADVKYQLIHNLPDYTRFHLASGQMRLFRHIVDDVSAHGVELVIFLPPLSEYELELIRQSGSWAAFQDWKRELASISQYWDFSGYNEVARTDRMFEHLKHFKPAVGYTILRRLSGLDCEGCGPDARIVDQAAIRVDESTIEEALKAQQQMMVAATRAPSRYSSLVAQVLAERRGPAGPALARDQHRTVRLTTSGH
jgi:hypothetical protein